MTDNLDHHGQSPAREGWKHADVAVALLGIVGSLALLAFAVWLDGRHEMRCVTVVNTAQPSIYCKEFHQ